MAMTAGSRVRTRTAKPIVPKHLRATGLAYLLISPMVIALGIFVFWLLVYSFHLSLHKVSFYKPPEYVGFRFYRFVLKDPQFYDSLIVGLKYMLIVVPTILVLSLLLAGFIKTVSTTMATFLKVTVYLPTAISVVVASVIFVFMYQDQGIVNYLTSFFGAKPIAWLNNSTTVIPAISLPGIWLGFGLSTLILLAGLLDIPNSYYESAALDGAGYFGRLRYITLPMLKNVLLYLIVTNSMLCMQEYLLPLIMTGGGPVGASTTPNMFIFGKFRDNTPFATSYSLTAALLLMVVLGAISVLIFRFIKSDKAIDA